MAAYLLSILVVKAHDELAQGVLRHDALLQLTTDEGQLEVKVVGVAGFQVMEQGGDADLRVVLKVAIPINSEVDDRQKGIGIHSVHLAGLMDGLVAKAETDAKRA